jgi:glycine/serine hydroxymethyltransferase
MVEEDMIRIAELIKRVVVEREDPSGVREYVRELTSGYREVKFSFESGDLAYKYVNL